MITRRKFLVGTGLGLAALGIEGCGLFDNPSRFRILGLSGAIPKSVVEQFQKEMNYPTDLKIETNPQDLWQKLQDLQKANKVDQVPDLISLSDAWLESAIAQSQIQPFPTSAIAKIPQWANLAPHWQRLVTRNNQVWGIPYRWGTTAIAYRENRIKFPITSWADLWRPELKRRLTLPDSDREVIGLVLKKLGSSYNIDDLTRAQQLETELKQLHEQVLTYNSDAYLQTLLNEDSWIAVGWSQDLRQIRNKDPEVKIVIPTEGTALWADIWVLPKQEPRPQNRELAYKWMNFCLQPAIATQITALTSATATLIVPDQIPKGVKSDPLRFPDQEILAKSELLFPLSQAATQQYQDLWLKIRS